MKEAELAENWLNRFLTFLVYFIASTTAGLAVTSGQ